MFSLFTEPFLTVLGLGLTTLGLACSDPSRTVILRLDFETPNFHHVKNAKSLWTFYVRPRLSKTQDLLHFANGCIAKAC
jgi:hypothetical protein